MRSPLLRLLRRSLRQAAAERTPSDPSRRSLLRSTALAGAALAVPGWLQSCTRPSAADVRHDVRVVIVGAGIAGLRAADILASKGIRADVYDGANRLGGRIMSVTDRVVPMAVTEYGGEYIDSNHTDILHLAERFDLPLIDLDDEAYQRYEDTFVFEGRRYTGADIVREIAPLIEPLRRDIARLPSDLRDLAESPAVGLDAISIESYLASHGVSGWLRAFFDVAFVTENGCELGDQSALNMLTLISTDVSGGRFDQFGDSDERFKVRGGNGLLISHLSKGLPGTIRTGHMLERLHSIGKTTILTFRKDNTSVEVPADMVLLALPFSVLRTVHIDVAFTPAKRRMIQELRYGANSKVMMGFGRPFWHDHGANGVVYTDMAPQLVWDNTALQGVGGGGLTFFSGGATCRDLGRRPMRDVATALVDDLTTVWPEARALHTGVVERYHWPGSRYAMGSYSSYAPGQWTAFYGREAQPEGTIYFAGEHCSKDFRGFMNGAAETGRMAATSMLASLGIVA